MKFGFTGDKVAISFGEHTVNRTLVAYRVGGLDWQFTNVTASSSHLLVTSRPHDTDLSKPQSFELRVKNWGYGVQVAGVHVASGKKLYKTKTYPRHIEIIGDSLSSGQYASYEAISSWAYLTAAGFGDTEFAITAYPGICAADKDCWGNPRGQVFQWFASLMIPCMIPSMLTVLQGQSPRRKLAPAGALRIEAREMGLQEAKYSRYRHYQSRNERQ